MEYLNDGLMDRCLPVSQQFPNSLAIVSNSKQYWWDTILNSVLQPFQGQDEGIDLCYSDSSPPGVIIIDIYVPVINMS